MRIGKAVELIHGGLETGFSLDALARQAYMCPSHFSHVFKEVTGTAPKQYSLQARIERARELLAASHLGIKDIAASLGFHDPHYFSKVFHKNTGETPTAFRRKKVRGKGESS
jgi:transcriptional regulator GlxA family with amidase domain